MRQRSSPPPARAIVRPVGCAGLALALAAAAAFAAPTAQFSDQETVLAVEVPVHVTIDGRPVSGLSADDFEVREGRRRQPIVGFDVFDLAVASHAASTAHAVDAGLPPAARRYFVLLFDLTQSEPRAVVRARTAARRWVTESLQPSDLVAVATWSYSQGASLQQTFTADRAQLSRVLETLALPAALPRRDPLGLLLADIERAAPGGLTGRARNAASAAAPAAEGDDALLASLIRLADVERSAARGERAADALAFSRSLAILARLLASVPGHKHVVLLSQGFDAGLLQGSFDAAEEAQAASAIASGEIWQVDSRQRYGEARIGNELARAITALQRADCAIQAIDIGGLLTDAVGDAARSDGRGTLLTLARETGGELYANFNNLGEAMDRLLEATRVTYLLTIAPRGVESDGRFRELRVRLRHSPSGTRVRHRPGYFAPRPDEQRPELDRQLETAQLLVAGAPGGELAAGLTTPIFPLADGTAHVPVIFEVDGRELLAETTRRESVPVAVYAYAFDGDGRVADFAAQSAELDLRELTPRLRREPLKLVGDLVLAPGRYSLRALVRVGAAGRFYLAHRELVVPAADATGLRVVAPLAVEPLDRGVVVRLTVGREERDGLPFPFVWQGEYFLPSGSPRLVEGQPLDLVLVVYGLDAGNAEIRGELLDGQGRHVSDVAIFVTGDEVSTDGRLRRFAISAASAGARPGEYALRVSVRQGERAAAAVAEVRVSR